MNSTKKYFIYIGFRPVTLINVDMFEKALDAFIREPGVDEDKTVVIFEITLSNLH